MTDEEYEKWKKANSQQPTKRHNWVEEKENARLTAEAKNRTGINAQIDIALDLIHREHGVGSSRLAEAIWNVMFFREYGSWYRVGLRLDDVAPERKRERTIERWMRIVYKPSLIDGDHRTKTIWDFTGKDELGRPERFSWFLKKLIDNGFKSIRQKALRVEKKRVHIEDNAIARADSGGISSDSAISQQAIPDVGELDTNDVPYELQQSLALYQKRIKLAYPEIGYALFNLGIDNASEISRLIKSGELAWARAQAETLLPHFKRPKLTKDREKIKSILDTMVAACELEIDGWIKKEQERLVAKTKGTRNEFVPKDLTDPDVMVAERRRYMGWKPRQKAVRGWTEPKLTKRQELELNYQKIDSGDPTVIFKSDWQDHMINVWQGGN
jgi:hypothetical protein